MFCNPFTCPSFVAFILKANSKMLAISEIVTTSLDVYPLKHNVKRESSTATISD